MSGQPVEVTNLPDTDSRDRVAYDLYQGLKGDILYIQPASYKNIVEQHLSLFVMCRGAVRTGNFDIEKLV